MSEHESDHHFSIGRAAAVCGICPATLRMWERRYGRPVPVRLPSGHRRYTCDQVRWLKRVAEALARGARASEAVQATEAELEALLHEEDTPGADSEVRRLLRLARGFRTTELVDALQDAWNTLGPRDFVLRRAAPFAVELGRAWADGRIEIRHEHHATAHVDDLLRVLRRSLTVPPGGPVLVLTTLPGETHTLGLQMVAILGALEGVATRVLGAESPLDEIIAATREMHAHAVGISVSLATGGPETDRTLCELRTLLPAETRLVVGGGGARGARRGPRGIEYVADLAEMSAWLAALHASHANDRSGARPA